MMNPKIVAEIAELKRRGELKMEDYVQKHFSRSKSANYYYEQMYWCKPCRDIVLFKYIKAIGSHKITQMKLYECPQGHKETM